MSNSKGFGVAGIVVVLVAVAALGFVVWRVWDTGQARVSDSPNQQANNQTNNDQPADPYAGWKTYCDDTKGACFKHPSGWNVETTSLGGGIAGANIKNANDSVTGTYVSSDTRDGTDIAYHAAVVEKVNADYSVVGGFGTSTPTIIPRLKIVDIKFANDLKAGSDGTMANTARFTFKDGSTGSLEFRPTNYAGMDSAQAKAWFTSDDAKTALLILKSFHLK